MLADTLLVFDHVTHKIKVVSHAHLDGDVDTAYREATCKINDLVNRLEQPIHSEALKNVPPDKSEMSSNFSAAEFEAIVSQAKEYIYAGDVIQAVLSQRLAKRTYANPFAIYRALRSINPSPYMYYLHLGDFYIAGASPELLVRVENGIVSTHPIAGTRRRGKNVTEDLALEEELKNDEKERAEHIMLVDLGRNDIGRISEPGAVEVTQLMDVERYSHVMHLVSHVQGKLRAGLSQFDVLRSCFPAGTVSGAPKIRAMEIIAELEKEQRGPYAGAVGYFDFSGNLDTAITIRTIVIKNNMAYIQAGAGIVADSVPEREYQESLNKAQALLTAIDQAEADQYAFTRSVSL
jgi:anthranilate synthase component 1